MKRILALALPLYALDQLTKWGIQRKLEEGMEWPMIAGFFSLVHLHNTGAAFSMLSDRNGFFLLLSGVALLVMSGLVWRGSFRSRISQTSAGLLIAGIAGNLTDRILHGHVVDFLLFDLHVPLANPWPAFNVADSCICVAAALLLIESAFFAEKPGEKAPGR